MTRHEDMMLTRRAARAMRGACALGVLALVTVALSACMSAEDRAARVHATQANVALNIDRMDAAAAPFERLCTAFMERADLYGYVEDAAARAKATGAPAPKPFGQHKPRDAMSNFMGWTIDGALLDGDVPEGVLLQVGGVLRAPIFEQNPLTMQQKFVSQDRAPFVLTCRLGFPVARPLDSAHEQALEDRGAARAQLASDAFRAKTGGTAPTRWYEIKAGAPVELGDTLHQFWGPVFQPEVIRSGGFTITRPPKKDAGFLMNSGSASINAVTSTPVSPC
jgi:hypothetical protein